MSNMTTMTTDCIVDKQYQLEEQPPGRKSNFLESCSSSFSECGSGDYNYALTRLYYRLQTQVEFYFSEANLARDAFLLGLLNSRDHQGRVPVVTIASFPKVRELYASAIAGYHVTSQVAGPADPAVLAQALRGSHLVQVSDDGHWFCPAVWIGKHSNKYRKEKSSLISVEQDSRPPQQASVDCAFACKIKTSDIIQESAMSSPTVSPTSLDLGEADKQIVSISGNSVSSCLILRGVDSTLSRQDILCALGLTEDCSLSVHPDSDNSGVWCLYFATLEQAQDILKICNDKECKLSGKRIHVTLEPLTTRSDQLYALQQKQKQFLIVPSVSTPSTDYSGSLHHSDSTVASTTTANPSSVLNFETLSQKSVGSFSSTPYNDDHDCSPNFDFYVNTVPIAKSTVLMSGSAVSSQSPMLQHGVVVGHHHHHHYHTLPAFGVPSAATSFPTSHHLHYHSYMPQHYQYMTAMEYLQPATPTVYNGIYYNYMEECSTGNLNDVNISGCGSFPLAPVTQVVVQQNDAAGTSAGLCSDISTTLSANCYNTSANDGKHVRVNRSNFLDTFQCTAAETFDSTRNKVLTTSLRVSRHNQCKTKQQGKRGNGTDNLNATAGRTQRNKKNHRWYCKKQQDQKQRTVGKTEEAPQTIKIKSSNTKSPSLITEEQFPALSIADIKANSATILKQSLKHSNRATPYAAVLMQNELKTITNDKSLEMQVDMITDSIEIMPLTTAPKLDGKSYSSTLIDTHSVYVKPILEGNGDFNDHKPSDNTIQGMSEKNDVLIISAASQVDNMCKSMKAISIHNRSRKNA